MDYDKGKRNMSSRKVHQVKLGAVIAYLLIILNSVYGIVMTPFIIGSIGEIEYGVYKTIGSFSATMMIIDLGLGGTVQRYIASFKSDKKEDEIPNFISMSLIVSVCINAIVLIVSIALYFLIGTIYGSSFDASQLELAKKLFIMLSANVMLTIIENVFHGVISGCNKFVFANGLKLMLLIVRICTLILLLNFFAYAITIVLIGIVISFITILAEFIYIKTSLKIKIKYSHWDKSVLKEAGKYTILMFLTSIASQIFSNLDNVVIGAVKGPELVSIYSVGLLFFGMFQNLSVGISGVMLPTITNVLTQEDGDKKVVDVIIKAGKAQFILLGAALVGFVCIGQEFVSVWMGEGFEDVYIITIILLAPAVFELCTNVCISILRAQNRLGFRTCTVIGSAVLNGILTFILVNVWSYIGAAVATACSYIVCNLIIMNNYYAFKIKLPMLKIYKGIMLRVFLCLAVSGLCLFLFSRYAMTSLSGSWLAIILDILFFCVIYGAMLLLLGLTKDEKKKIPIIKRFIK